MLTRFGFRGKMYYLCISEEERARKYWVLSSFFCTKNRIFTSEIDFSTLLRKIFLGVCGFFLRNVGGFLGDVERLKVKTYLFSQGAFLTFQGSTQVKVVRGQGSNVKVPHLACKV